MTREAIAKLNILHKFTLEQKRRDRQRLAEAGRKAEAVAVRSSTAGYLQALRDCGVITERERQTLFVYYGTM